MPASGRTEIHDLVAKFIMAKCRAPDKASNKNKLETKETDIGHMAWSGLKYANCPRY
jgi:hypothetical protein